MTTHHAADPTPAPDVAAALRIILDHCAAAANEAKLLSARLERLA